MDANNSGFFAIAGAIMVNAVLWALYYFVIVLCCGVGLYAVFTLWDAVAGTNTATAFSNTMEKVRARVRPGRKPKQVEPVAPVATPRTRRTVAQAPEVRQTSGRAGRPRKVDTAAAAAQA